MNVKGTRMTTPHGVTSADALARTLLLGMTESGPDLRVATGDRLQVVRAIAPTGAIIPMHRHEAEQITFLIEGRIEVTIGDEVFTAAAGDIVRVPGNVPHEFRIIERMVAVEAVSPVRPELIPVVPA